jgi:Polyketide cyclase / dehydrase and lipid transport
MQTSNTVEMNAPLETILARAIETERWPVILPHYRWVRVLDGGGDRKTVEMAARRGVIPVRWRATQMVDRGESIPVIRFKHIWGVTKGMEVAWTFTPLERGTSVTIDHEFNPNWPIGGAFAAERIIGPHFVHAIASRTLACIKAIVEGNDVRFDVNAQPRP